MPDQFRPLRVLHLCYAPLSEPLIHTQVIAYLRGLAARGHTIHLLTFETEKLTPAYLRLWRKRLKQDGISWHALSYHQKPALPSSLFDIAAGALKAARLVRRHRLQAVHCRAQVAAAMGLLVKQMTGCQMIFDVRGLMAEERQEFGFWKPNDPSFRAVKWLENRALERADAVVTLTQRLREKFGEKLDGKIVRVIPCCADLSRIESQIGQRDTIRRELDLRDKTVLLYAGKFGGYYLGKEMAEFFLAAREIVPNLHFLVLSQTEASEVRSELTNAGLGNSDFSLLRVAPENLGAYLAAADGGIAFRAEGPAQIAASPTKIGEYLAAGLPILFNRGIGDQDAILENIGVELDDFTPDAYRKAAQKWRALLGDETARKRCQEAAHVHFSLEKIGVPRYDEVYRELAVSS